MSSLLSATAVSTLEIKWLVRVQHCNLEFFFWLEHDDRRSKMHVFGGSSERLVFLCIALSWEKSLIKLNWKYINFLWATFCIALLYLFHFGTWLLDSLFFCCPCRPPNTFPFFFVHAVLTFSTLVYTLLLTWYIPYCMYTGFSIAYLFHLGIYPRTTLQVFLKGCQSLSTGFCCPNPSSFLLNMLKWHPPWSFWREGRTSRF